MAYPIFSDELKCGIPQIDRQHTYGNLRKRTTLYASLKQAAHQPHPGDSRASRSVSRVLPPSASD